MDAEEYRVIQYRNEFYVEVYITPCGKHRYSPQKIWNKGMQRGMSIDKKIKKIIGSLATAIGAVSIGMSIHARKKAIFPLCKR